MSSEVVASDPRGSPLRPGSTTEGRLSPQRSFALVGVLAVTAAAATFVATRHGPALSPDSVTYLSAARNLASGRGYLDFTGSPDTTFPPGFPALLAAAKSLGLSLSTSARLLNASAFAAIVGLTWLLVRRHVASNVVLVCTTLLVTVSPVLLNVTAEVWSEPVFCALLLGFVLALEEVASSSGHGAFIVWAGAIAGSAILVRYAGLALLLTGVIVCGVAPWGMSVRKRGTRVGLFLLGALPLPVLWVARNALSGAPYLLGPRVAVGGSPWTIVWMYVKTFASLWVPTPAIVGIAIGLALVAIVTFGIWLVLRRADPPGLRICSRRAAPLLTITIVYTVFLVAAGEFSGASIDARTVMPLYVPALVVGAGLADGARCVLRRRACSRWSRPARRMALATALGCVTIVGIGFARTAWTDGRVARGYGSAAARPSTVAQAVKGLSADALVVTNRPWTLYYATGHQPVVPPPGPLYPSVSIVPATLDQVSDQACTRSVYLAWFTAAPPHRGVPPSLGSEVTIHALASRKDGVLFKVVPRQQSRCDPAAS